MLEVHLNHENIEHLFVVLENVKLLIKQECEIYVCNILWQVLSSLHLVLLIWNCCFSDKNFIQTDVVIQNQQPYPFHWFKFSLKSEFISA